MNKFVAERPALRGTHQPDLVPPNRFEAAMKFLREYQMAELTQDGSYAITRIGVAALNRQIRLDPTEITRMAEKSMDFAVIRSAPAGKATPPRAFSVSRLGRPGGKSAMELAKPLIRTLPDRSLKQLYGLWQNATKLVETGEVPEKRIASRMVLYAITGERRSRADANLKSAWREGSFRWPSTDVSSGGTHELQIEAQALGMLASAGYRVGTSRGTPELDRQKLLDRLFLANLPDGHDADYVKDWGPPDSGPRLKKIADSIATFTRNAKRHPNNLDVAVSEWEADLEYLRSRHYVGRFDFEWPSTAVGKHSLRPMDKDFRSSVLRP